MAERAVADGIRKVGATVVTHPELLSLPERAGSREFLKKAVDLRKNPGGRRDPLGMPRLLEESAAGAGIVEALDRLAQGVLGDRKAEMPRGHLLDRVSFI